MSVLSEKKTNGKNHNSIRLGRNQYHVVLIDFFFFLGSISEKELSIYVNFTPFLEYLLPTVSAAAITGEVPSFPNFLSRLHFVALRAILVFLYFTVSCGCSIRFFLPARECLILL